MTNKEKFYKLALKIMNASVEKYAVTVSYILGSRVWVDIDLGINESIIFQDAIGDEPMKITYQDGEGMFPVYYECSEENVEDIDKIIYRLKQGHNDLVKNFFKSKENEPNQN